MRLYNNNNHNHRRHRLIYKALVCQETSVALSPFEGVLCQMWWPYCRQQAVPSSQSIKRWNFAFHLWCGQRFIRCRSQLAKQKRRKKI